VEIAIIESSYDSGQRGVRMGAGPKHLLESGLVGLLEAMGHQTTVETIDPAPAFPAEVGTSFAVMRDVASSVAVAASRGAFPLVLAGNCGTSVGTISGLAPLDLGIVWFDAHADFNTPESTSTGFFDGMALAIATGHCWQLLAHDIPGYRPVKEDHVILAGARDFDTLERERLSASKIGLFSDLELKHVTGESQLGSALDRLSSLVDGIYLHIDVDVHDPELAAGNHLQPAGGLAPGHLRDLIALIGGRSRLLAACISAFDPTVDSDGTTLDSSFALVETIVSSVVTG
jgi:arginase